MKLSVVSPLIGCVIFVSRDFVAPVLKPVVSVQSRRIEDRRAIQKSISFGLIEVFASISPGEIATRHN